MVWGVLGGGVLIQRLPASVQSSLAGLLVLIEICAGGAMTYSGCRAALAIALRRPAGALASAPAVHGLSHGSALRCEVVGGVHRIQNKKRATRLGGPFFYLEA